MNVNEVFRKDVPYKNIKSHRKQGFPLSLEYTFLEKPQGGDQIDPPAVLGLIHININMYIFSFTTLLQLIYCSRFCCFTTPIAMPNNDYTLIYVNHTQLKYQNKNIKILKI